MNPYPYVGVFYTESIDDSLPLDERVVKTTIVFETVCDIQRTAKLHNGNLLGANYTVYFPLEKNPNATADVDKFKDIVIRRGMKFKGTFYGYDVIGEVEIVRPSQLGGCSCDIKVVSENATE